MKKWLSMNHFVRANHEEEKLLKGIWQHNRSEGFASRSEASEAKPKPETKRVRL